MLIIQGSKFNPGWFPGAEPIDEERAQLIVYGKVFYKDGKLYDKDYEGSAWVWYKNANYDDSNIECVAHPGEEDYMPPMDTKHPMFKDAKDLVKGLKEDLKQLAIKIAEFILALPEAIIQIVLALLSLISSIIIIPPGSGVPTALTAVQTVFRTIKALQEKVAELLPFLSVLKKLGIVLSKQAQAIISQIIAVITVILGIIGSLTSILGLLNKVVEAFKKLMKKKDEQKLEVDPRASDTNLEPGESTKLDAYPSGGSWDYDYQWTDDQGNVIGTDRNVSIAPEKTTIYTAKVTDKTTGEVKEGTVRIKIRPMPEKGASGTSGTSGSSGKPGTSGTSGASGSSGVSPSGSSSETTTTTTGSSETTTTTTDGGETTTTTTIFSPTTSLPTTTPAPDPYNYYTVKEFSCPGCTLNSTYDIKTLDYVAPGDYGKYYLSGSVALQIQGPTTSGAYPEHTLLTGYVSCVLACGTTTTTTTPSP